MRIRYNSGVRRVLMLTLLLCVGFDWPGRAERLLSDLERPMSEAVRRDLLRLLATVDTQAAYEALARASTDPHPSVRAEALRGLGHAHDARYADAARVALKDPEVAVRRAAIETVGALQPSDAVALLTRSLSDSEPGVRTESARVLGQLGDAQAVPALSSALDDASTDVRVAAARALGRLGDERAAGPLLSKARDGAPELREAVVDALHSLGGERAAPILAQALADSTDIVVLAGMRAAAGRGLGPWLPTLRELSQSPRPRVRAAASALLARAEQKPQANHAASDEATWLSALERTLTTPPDAIPELLTELARIVPRGEPLVADPLLEWLPRVPPALQPRVVQLIGASGARGAAPALLALLDKAPRALELAILDALAELGAETEGAKLLERLEQPDAEVREAAARALAGTARSDLLPTLASALDHTEPGVKRALLRAVAGILLRSPGRLDARNEDALVDALRRALDDGDAEVFALGTRSLALLGSERAARALGSLEPGDDTDRQLAVLRAAAAFTTGPSANASLRHVPDEAPPEVRATALEAAALAGDALQLEHTLALARGSRWPLGPAASFAIAHAARPDRVKDVGAALCKLRQTADAWSRANMLAGLARMPALDCVDDVAPRWLLHGRAVSVRHAAALWARARLSVHDDANLRATLARCGREDASPSVRAACLGTSAPELPSGNNDRSEDESQLSPGVRALRLADGLVLVSFPDATLDPSWPRLRYMGEELPFRAPYGLE